MLTVIIFKFLLEPEFIDEFLVLPTLMMRVSSCDYFLLEFVLRLVTSRPSLRFFIGSTEFSLDLRFKVFSRSKNWFTKIAYAENSFLIDIETRSTCSGNTSFSRII